MEIELAMDGRYGELRLAWNQVGWEEVRLADVGREHPLPGSRRQGTYVGITRNPNLVVTS